MSVEEWRGVEDLDLDICTINKIKDALDVDFAWMKYPQGITLPLESLYIILSAINNLERGNR